MQKKWSVVFLLLFILFCSGCAEKDKWAAPEDGIWWCKELEMQLCFERWDDCTDPEVLNGDETYSYMIEDGKTLMCAAWRSAAKHNQRRINVVYQDYVYWENMGEHKLHMDGVRVDKNEFLVETENGDEFIFVRIPYFSVSDLDPSSELPETVANVGELNYIGHVVEQVYMLWQTTYADAQISKNAIVVSFDMEADCWFASCQIDADEKQATLMALIQRNGDVLSVWQE